MSLLSRARRTFSPLTVRNYRLFFFAQLISLTGTWMQVVAQSWLVLTITGSGTALGSVVALQFLPMLIIGPWGGVLADRWSTRKILYITNSFDAVLAFLLGFLVATGVVELWMIYTLALALGLVNAIDTTARKVFVMELVGAKYIKNAVLLNGTLLNSARLVGPAIAGVLIAKVGIPPSFFINGFSFFITIIALKYMRSSELLAKPSVAAAKGQVRAGLRYVRDNSILFQILIMIAIIGTLTLEFQVVFPLFAKFTLNGDAGTYAALTSLLSAGAIAGGLWGAGRKKDVTQMAVVWSAFATGFAVLLLAVAPNLWLALIAVFLVGASVITYTSFSQALLQLRASPEMRGRVMSLWTVGMLGSTPVGGFIIGYISEVTSPRVGLAVGSVAAIIAGMYGLSRQKAKNKTGNS